MTLSLMYRTYMLPHLAGLVDPQQWPRRRSGSLATHRTQPQHWHSLAL
ncbi:hypothetical protein NAB48_18360 [Proteus mirabilis]|nr:hypothetical protein [Proteus mirabilis]